MLTINIFSFRTTSLTSLFRKLELNILTDEQKEINIRLLLVKQSDHGLCCFPSLSDIFFIAGKQTFLKIWE